MSFNIKRFEFNFGELKEAWPILKFEEVCMKEKGSIISGPFGSNISSKFFVETGVPVIRGNNLTQDSTRFVDEGFVYVTQEKADSLNTFAIIDDLVFTAAGTIGQVGIITSKCRYEEYIISNKQMRARLDRSKVNPLFAYYWFSTKNMNKYINLLNTGSTIPLINLSILKNLPIPVPELDVQNKIVEIIDSIDKKIETNNKINKKLEEMAQAIFKQWFVDFEFPNEDGKPYKSSGGEMVENEFGMIPKCWKSKELKEVIKFAKGKKPKIITDKEFDNSELYLTIDVLNRNSIQYAVNDKVVLANKKDILMVMDGASSGSLYYGLDGIVGSTLSKLVINDEYINEDVLYYFLKLNEFNIKGHLTGSAIPHTDKEYVNRLIMCIPSDKELLVRVTKILSDIREKVIINNEENSRLIKLRDILLPKLMSGEIRVPIN